MTTIFATTNSDKFNRTRSALTPHGIDLIQKKLELSEIQSFSGEEIAIDKATQAYNQLLSPVLVTDDSWEIPSLNNFPGTSMKQCNHYLTADDWLRLMSDSSDRRMYLISHYSYYNGKSIETRTVKSEMYFLSASGTAFPKAPCLEVIARKNDTKCVAERLKNGEFDESENADFWKQLAAVIRQ